MAATNSSNTPGSDLRLLGYRTTGFGLQVFLHSRIKDFRAKVAFENRFVKSSQVFNIITTLDGAKAFAIEVLQTSDQ